MKHYQAACTATCLCFAMFLLDSRAEAQTPDTFVFDPFYTVCEANWAGNNTWACDSGRRAFATFTVPDPADPNQPNYYTHYDATQNGSFEDICLAQASAMKLVPKSDPIVLREECAVHVSYYDPFGSGPSGDGWFDIGSSIEGGTLNGSFDLRVSPDALVCQCEYQVVAPK